MSNSLPLAPDQAPEPANKETLGRTTNNEWESEAETPLDLEKIPTTRSAHPLEQTDVVRKTTPFRWFLICAALYVSCFLYGLDTTVAGAMQAPIIEDFKDVSKLGWVGIGFPLGSIATILPLGKGFGIFDAKWVYVGSVILFEVGSALCGGAPDMNALIVGRVLAGAGGAGLYLGCLNIVGINTSIRERPVYISGIAVTWGIGCIVGPLIGGAFADSGATWRWAFYINLVFFGCFAPVYFFVLESYDPQPEKTLSDKVKDLDWVGTVLNCGLFVAFVILFTFGGSLWSWNDGRVIALFVVFGVLLITFAVQQTFAIFTDKEKRLFPVDFLRSRDLVLQFIAMSSGAAALYLPIYYVPLFFAFARGDSAIRSAVRLLPFLVVTIVCILLQGVTMPKVRYYQPYYLISGMALIAAGASMHSLLKADVSNSVVYGLCVLSGVGAGISQQAAYSVVQAKIAPTRIADAVNFINFAQLGSMVYVLTIGSAIFQDVGFKHLSSALEGAGVSFTADDVRSALAGAKSDIFNRVTPAVRDILIEKIVDLIAEVYILVIVAGAVSLVAALCMKREKLVMEIAVG